MPVQVSHVANKLHYSYNTVTVRRQPADVLLCSVGRLAFVARQGAEAIQFLLTRRRELRVVRPPASDK